MEERDYLKPTFSAHLLRDLIYSIVASFASICKHSSRNKVRVYLCKKTSTSGLMLVLSALICIPSMTTAMTPDTPSTSSPM